MLICLNFTSKKLEQFLNSQLLEENMKTHKPDTSNFAKRHYLIILIHVSLFKIVFDCCCLVRINSALPAVQETNENSGPPTRSLFLISEKLTRL